MEVSSSNNTCQSTCSCEEDSIIAPPRSLRSPLRTSRRKSGYECEFIDPAPTLIQTECSICLLILREPYLIGCCGHNFCKECIDKVKAIDNPCPLCGETEYGVLPNKGLQRVMNELKVQCSKKSLGCQWTGELGRFTAHLNENYTAETQLDGCDFVEVECGHGCGSRYLRHLISKHQTDKCPQRPFCCDYCREYNSIHADVVYRHWPVCKAYPMTCPNKCTVYAIERQNMESHLELDCPLKVIECEFQYAGCTTKLPRQDMPSHLSECYLQHISLLSSLNQKLVEDLSIKDDEFMKYSDEVSIKLSNNKLEIDQLRKENTILKFTLAEMQKEMGQMFEAMKHSVAELREQHKVQEEKLQQQSSLCQSSVKDLHAKQDSVHSELSAQCYSIQAHMGLFPVVFKLSEFEKHRDSGTEWTSPVFRSSRDGYSMCLVIDCNGSSHGGFVSVYACLKQGDSDNALSWPFRGEITIQLLNRLGDRHHATGTIRFTEFTPSAYAARVYGSDHGPKGWGQQKFIGHQELGYNDVKKRQYLLNNCLCFRISRVEVFHS